MLGIDGKIALFCPHCGILIKEKAQKIRADAVLHCSACRRDISFSPSSPNESVRKALSAARKSRREANN
jgi:hypothetical protein